MALHIHPKEIGGHTYYYAHRTWREKLDPRTCGKTRGSGKSRMRSETIYLGAAEQIVEALHKTRQPIEVRHRAFGMVAAAYQTAIEAGLVDVLRKHIGGERFGVPRWLFFLLPILNRLQHATSKARMGEWAAGTVLPSLLGFDAKRLNSQTSGYVTATVTTLIKQELDDLHEITIVYDAHTADVKISARSSVQQRLYDLFNLSPAENLLTRHNPHPHPQQ